jgi:hypothetical protein
LKYNGGNSGIKISVFYWRCSLIRVSVIRGFTDTALRSGGCLLRSDGLRESKRACLGQHSVMGLFVAGFLDQSDNHQLLQRAASLQTTGRLLGVFYNVKKYAARGDHVRVRTSMSDFY